MRVYNRFRQHSHTMEYIQFGTFIKMDGCLAVIQHDEYDWLSFCVPDDYAIVHDNQRYETILLSDYLESLK